MKNLKEKLRQIPKFSGVYIFKDINNTIIYIGKALNLYNRVKFYFNKTNDIKTKALIKKIDNIDYFITNNEVEALLLENNLIKKYHPRYNIQLKDAKSYPMLKIINEELPRIIKCREKIQKNGEYYGPFIRVEAVKILQKIFSEILKIRPCRKKFKKPYNYSPCMYYHIGRCSAPCSSKITVEEYRQSVQMAREVLKGKIKPVLGYLKDKMNDFSDKLEYENAAKLRDQINILLDYEAKQSIDTQSDDDCDYIGIFSDFKKAVISLIEQRKGKVLDKKNFLITNIIDYSTILYDFLKTYYLNINKLPKKIFIQKSIEEKKILINAIKDKFNHDLTIDLPVFLKDKKLLILAKENAEIYFEEQQYKLEKIHELRELKNVLGLKNLPRNIEGFDVATINGKSNTASLVSFIDGKANKSGYRIFGIADQEHPDDYGMMKEVIARRYQRLKNEGLKMPDLILVDGGPGQVNSAGKVLSLLDLDIMVVGLAKKNEYVYVENKKKPLVLPEKSLALRLLQKVRDEAHRFSNTILKKRFTKKSIQTKLSQIEGLGDKRINLLFKEFGTIDSLLNSSVDKIAQVGNIGKKNAEKIYKFIHGIDF